MWNVQSPERKPTIYNSQSRDRERERERKNRILWSVCQFKASLTVFSISLVVRVRRRRCGWWRVHGTYLPGTSPERKTRSCGSSCSSRRRTARAGGWPGPGPGPTGPEPRPGWWRPRQPGRPCCRSETNSRTFLSSRELMKELSHRFESCLKSHSSSRSSSNHRWLPTVPVSNLSPRQLWVLAASRKKSVNVSVYVWVKGKEFGGVAESRSCSAQLSATPPGLSSEGILTWTETHLELLSLTIVSWTPSSCGCINDTHRAAAVSSQQ